jgi:hypothetical protein
MSLNSGKSWKIVRSSDGSDTKRLPREADETKYDFAKGTGSGGSGALRVRTHVSMCVSERASE